MVLLTNNIIRQALHRRHYSICPRSTSPLVRIFFSSYQLNNNDNYNDDHRFRNYAKRHLSSRKRSQNSFQLDALPFRVSPQEAYTHFQTWAINEQGLGPFLSIGGPIGSATMTAAYTPFWYFDLNVRFVPTTNNNNSSRRRRDTTDYSNYIPQPFKSAYPRTPNGIIHIPGLASYAGFSYRRTLIDPVHNTTPVFRQKDITPFGTWMLEPLRSPPELITSNSGEEMMEIFPDPWNATRERSLNVIYEELVEMANDKHHHDHSDD